MTRAYTRRKPVQQEGEMSDQQSVIATNSPVSPPTGTADAAQVDMRMFLELQKQTLELQNSKFRQNAQRPRTILITRRIVTVSIRRRVRPGHRALNAMSTMGQVGSIVRP